jgi:hypothetical protein
VKAVDAALAVHQEQHGALALRQLVRARVQLGLAGGGAERHHAGARIAVEHGSRHRARL